ncbi:MAG: M23 family metallopeptidase [Sphingobium sp.]
MSKGGVSRAASVGLLGFMVVGCVPQPGGSPPSRAAPVHPVQPAPTHQKPATAHEISLTGSARQGGVMIGHAPPGTRMLQFDGRPVPVARDGSFLIAFDRDAPPAATLVAFGQDGSETRRSLSVAPGDWPIEHVNASITGGVTTAEFKQRRAIEVQRIAAAREGMKPNSSEGWRQEFVWPIVARISGRFGAQRVYRGTPGSYHSGVDLAAAQGTTYVAPADGVVVLAATVPYTLEGNLLIIDHGMGLNSAFLHSQRLLVKEGDMVRRGQPIGIVGATGRATGPHLHWGMKWQDARLDPVTMVKLDATGR